MPKTKEETATLKAKVDEVAKQVEEIAETTGAEEKEQSAQDLQVKLKSLNQQLEETQKEAKAHQKNVSKKEEENQRLQAQIADIDGVKNTVGVLTQMVADLMDSQPLDDEGEPQPKRRRSEEYLKRIQDDGSQSAKRKHQTIIDKVLGQLQAAGLDATAMDSPEFVSAKVKFLEGKPEEGLKEVEKIITQKTEANKEPENKETVEELTKRLREEVKKEILIERGELDAETGQPASSVGVFTREQIANMSPKEYKEKREDIEKAYLADKIK